MFVLSPRASCSMLPEGLPSRHMLARVHPMIFDIWTRLFFARMYPSCLLNFIFWDAVLRASGFAWLVLNNSLARASLARVILFSLRISPVARASTNLSMMIFFARVYVALARLDLVPFGFLHSLARLSSRELFYFQ